MLNYVINSLHTQLRFTNTMSSLKYIFLVDDDTDDQELFIEALSGVENVSLFGAANTCTEALKTLKSCSLLPDFIFLDYNMPAMNGIECLCEIIKNPRTKNIPVVMLSSAFEQEELAHKRGAKGFIKKTSDIPGLKTVLNQIINSGVTINYI